MTPAGPYEGVGPPPPPFSSWPEAILARRKWQAALDWKHSGHRWLAAPAADNQASEPGGPTPADPSREGQRFVQTPADLDAARRRRADLDRHEAWQRLHDSEAAGEARRLAGMLADGLARIADERRPELNLEELLVMSSTAAILRRLAAGGPAQP